MKAKLTFSTIAMGTITQIWYFYGQEVHLRTFITSLRGDSPHYEYYLLDLN